MTDLAAWIAEKRAASAGATEGPWEPSGGGVIVRDLKERVPGKWFAAHVASYVDPADARHIAAFDPATTRRLIDAAEVLAAFVEKVEAGKARSTDTYNRAKAALDALRGGGE